MKDRASKINLGAVQETLVIPLWARAKEAEKDTIKVIEDYPMLSRLPARHDLNRRTIWGLRVASLFRLYNMVHVQL